MQDANIISIFLIDEITSVASSIKKLKVSPFLVIVKSF